MRLPDRFASLKTKKLVLLLLLGMFCCYFLGKFVTQKYMIAFSRPNHYCFPYKVYLVKKGLLPKKGDFVVFTGYNIDNFQDGVQWIKKVIGMEGDKVEVDLSEHGYEYVMLDNGTTKLIKIRAIVKLISSDGSLYTFRALEKDTRDRSLQIIAPTVIQKGEYFVFSPFQRALDSRYWGLVKKEWVIGVAYPLF